MTNARKYLVTELDAERDLWGAVSLDGDDMVSLADGPAVHVLQAVSVDIHRDKVNEALGKMLDTPSR